jgi:hypothetical protein
MFCVHEKFESETTQVIIKVYNQLWMHTFGANRLGEQASGVGDEEVWSRLWQMAVPGKIKIFGWRVLHGLIYHAGEFLQIARRIQVAVQHVMGDVKILNTSCLLVTEQKMFG